MKNRFQDLPFKCNLHRYTKSKNQVTAFCAYDLDGDGGAVQVEFSLTHKLESAWFQPLSL